MRSRALVLICIVMLSYSSAIASSDNHGPSEYNELLSINIQNIQTRSLVRLISELTSFNVVISSELRNDRIDVIKDDATVLDLVNDIAVKQGLYIKKSDNILVIASECRISNSFTGSDQTKLEDKLSLKYSSVSVATILQAFEIVSNSEINISGIDNTAPLTIQVESKQIREIMQAVAIAEGWTYFQMPDDTVRIAVNPKVERCKQKTKANSRNSEVALVTKLVHPSENRKCSKENPKCEKLEEYDLEGMRVLGRIDNLSNSVRRVVIETPDKFTFAPQAGNYLGKNYGRIESIDSSGNTELSEIVPDNMGGYIERKVVLKSGIELKSPEPFSVIRD